MVLSVQVSVRNVSLSPEIEADVRERATALPPYFARLTACRVVIERSPGPEYSVAALNRVRIELTVPAGEIVIRRRPHQDLHTAVLLAFNAARRRLQDYARRRRGAVRAAGTS